MGLPSNRVFHFFAVENVRWRALPERFGPWNSVWKRFDRLSKAGVFEALFEVSASMSSSAHFIQMFDSTIIRAPLSARAAIADKGYAGKAYRAAVRAQSIARSFRIKTTRRTNPPSSSGFSTRLAPTSNRASAPPSASRFDAKKPPEIIDPSSAGPLDYVSSNPSTRPRSQRI
jgi:transposase